MWVLFFSLFFLVFVAEAGVKRLLGEKGKAYISCRCLISVKIIITVWYLRPSFNGSFLTDCREQLTTQRYRGGYSQEALRMDCGPICQKDFQDCHRIVGITLLKVPLTITYRRVRNMSLAFNPSPQGVESSSGAALGNHWLISDPEPTLNPERQAWRRCVRFLWSLV